MRHELRVPEAELEGLEVVASAKDLSELLKEDHIAHPRRGDHVGLE